MSWGKESWAEEAGLKLGAMLDVVESGNSIRWGCKGGYYGEWKLRVMG
jgi:hypothetical protein